MIYKYTSGYVQSILMVATEVANFSIPEDIVLAYTRLDENYRHVVYSFVKKSVRDPEIAADLTQDALLKAFRGLPAALERGNLQEKSWLFTIAAHLVIDRSRRRKFQEKVAPMERFADSDELIAEDDPQQTAELHETQERVRGVLSQMKTEQGQALEMYYLQDLSFQETADQLGISWAAVKSLLVRGRVSFKKEYLKHPEFDRT